MCIVVSFVFIHATFWLYTRFVKFLGKIYEISGIIASLFQFLYWRPGYAIRRSLQLCQHSFTLCNVDCPCATLIVLFSNSYDLGALQSSGCSTADRGYRASDVHSIFLAHDAKKLYAVLSEVRGLHAGQPLQVVLSKRSNFFLGPACTLLLTKLGATN